MASRKDTVETFLFFFGTKSTNQVPWISKEGKRKERRLNMVDDDLEPRI
jgi:hypothetical protein